MAPTLVNSYAVSSAGQNTATLTTPSFTPSVGEIIVVKWGNEDVGVPSIGAVSGGSLTYTNRASSSGVSSHAEVYVYTTTVVSASSMTVSVAASGSAGNHWMLVERWSGALLAGTPATNATKTGTGSAPSATITTTGTTSIVTWINNDWNATTGTAAYRSSASEDGALLVASHIRFYAAYQSAASAGSQTIGLTAPTGQNWSMVGIEVLSSVVITPVAATDSGSGDDTTIGLARFTTQTDPGTGVDNTTILRAGTGTDSGTGTDTPVIEILAPVAATDTGTGTDTPTIFPFVPIAASDAGVGSETPTLVINTFVPQTDTGTGVDTHAIKDARAGVTETATGVETFNVIAVNTHTDNGIAVDDVTVVDIPYTQVLPAFRQGTVYDLVVVARVPQQAAAAQFFDVDPIEWSTLQWTNSLSNPQELQITCLMAGLTDPVITRLRDLATQPTELWLYRNGRVVFAGPIQTGSVNGESLTLNARGLMTYLSGMFVTSDLVYKATDQFQVVKGLVDHWQALDYGNYGLDTSKITNSGVTLDVTYLKSELHNIGQRIIDLGKTATGFDVEVDPVTRQVQLWYPQKGVDRSSGEDAVVFDARNIASSNIMFSVTPNDVASEAFGTGTANSSDGNLYGTAANLDLRAKYGRSGVSGTFSSVPDQSTLDTFVQALVNARNAALMVPGPEARDTPDADIGSYGVGDTILYQPNELLTISSAYRIRKQTVKVASTGQETLSLEFV